VVSAGPGSELGKKMHRGSKKGFCLHGVAGDEELHCSARFRGDPLSVFARTGLRPLLRLRLGARLKLAC
jgi:hypothetical protein